MAKKESTFLNMVLTLFVITAIASLALGGIYTLTKEPIALAKKIKRELAIREVIPDFDTLVIDTLKYGDDILLSYIGKKGDQVVGTAVASFSNKGYDPMQIQIMVGFLPDGTIMNTAVTQQKETPGLGTKMEDPEFKDKFMGVNPETFKLKVKKDRGDIDAITAATISSRAFCDAVERAYNAYKNKGGDE